MKNEIMYDINSILLAIMLFVAIMLFYELGFRIGKRKQEATDKEVKEQTSAIQAGILGLLTLLLGFTFNMALARLKAEQHYPRSYQGLFISFYGEFF